MGETVEVTFPSVKNRRAGWAGRWLAAIVHIAVLCPAAAQAIGSSGASGGFWNKVGETACPPTRNYLQQRVITALNQFYMKAGVPRPGVTDKACAVCISESSSTRVVPGSESFAEILAAAGGLSGASSVLSSDIECMRVARSNRFPAKSAATVVETPTDGAGKKARSGPQLVNCVSASSAVELDLSRMPCESPEFLEYLAVGFRMAAKCAGVSPAEVFPLFAAESGFQPLLRGSDQSAGMGQLSPSAVEEVERLRSLPSVLSARYAAAGAVQQMEESLKSLPGCAPFRQEFQGSPLSGHRCEQVAFPESYLQDLRVSLQYYASRRAIAEEMIGRDPRIQRRYPSEKDRNRLVVEAAYYSYRGGEAYSGQLKAHLLRAERSVPVEKVLEDFRGHLSRTLAEKSAAPLLGGAAALEKTFERSGGRRCFAD